MDLHTIERIVQPRTLEAFTWTPGTAYLAGGTWLFSQPQVHTDTLVDLATLGWPALDANGAGLTIAATCRIAELFRFPGQCPSEWRAAPLITECCNAFLASFKIWNAATVGGNIVMSLPAGPMTSLTAALEGVCTLWPREGAARTLPVAAFVTGDNRNALASGEILRSIHIPVASLHRRTAFRHVSLTKLGRSAALIIGTAGVAGDLVLTITAATHHPIQLRFPAPPSAAVVKEALAAIPMALWFTDPHGRADYKRHVTFHFAESIRQELAA